MKTFEQCCEYLGIDNALPTCHIDEKKFQAAYKLRVCMTAWNKQDGFVPDEIANNDHGKMDTLHIFILEMVDCCHLVGQFFVRMLESFMRM